MLLAHICDVQDKRIAYEYDFGDSWIHAVGREALVDADASRDTLQPFIEEGKRVSSGTPRAAICIAGARNGPPEDCGGLYRYGEILNVLVNRKRARSASAKKLLEWVGDDDPDRFEHSEINHHPSKIRMKKNAAQSDPSGLSGILSYNASRKGRWRSRQRRKANAKRPLIPHPPPQSRETRRRPPASAAASP